MKVLLITTCLFFIAHISAQSIDRQLVGSGGESFSTPSINLSFSVGEAVIGSFSTPSIIISQGFQQADDSTDVGILEVSLDDDLIFYPNPVSNELFIEFVNVRSDLDVSINVYDLNGRSLIQQTARVQQASGEIIRLKMDRISAGTYLVTVIDRSGIGSRFSVVKIE